MYALQLELSASIIGAMPSKARTKLFSRFGHLYLPFKPPGFWQASACVYCGNRAQSRDHIPPLVWLYCLGPSYFERDGLLIVWVPACLQCNVALTDRRLFTIAERTAFLLQFYTDRYAAILQTPVWDDAQLGELRGQLKERIGTSEEFRKGITRRLAILAENNKVRSLPESI